MMSDRCSMASVSRAKTQKIFGLYTCLYITVVATLLMLAACGGPSSFPQFGQSPTRNCPPPPEFHRVQRGETLFRIGWRYCLGYRDIALWNDLASPDRILVGQRLRLYGSGRAISNRNSSIARTNASSPAPAVTPRSRPKAPEPEVRSKPPSPGKKGWEWPSQGKVVSRFNPSVLGHNGIRISGRSGQTVKAASPGQIVYTGSSLPGYGTLIIVEHSGGLLSAYGYLGKLYVKEGDNVRKGQAIAELGVGDNNRPALHFEIRKNGQPVNPLRYLPS